MIVDELGYRPPQRFELARAIVSRALPRILHPISSNRSTVLPVAHLYADPLITYSGMVPKAPIAFASVTKGKLRHKRAYILASPTWSLNDMPSVRAARSAAIVHRTLNPLHKIIFLCNTQSEMQKFHSVGEAAIFHTKSSCVSEEIFKPLQNVPIAFDAIYNAQIRKWKRHELSVEIETCAFIYYRAVQSDPFAAEENTLIAQHRVLAPDHVFLNKLEASGLPVPFSPAEVNLHLNRATVGLCLSEVEGAMIASVEYMLAGLPIVSTASSGGREVFFDSEYCLEVKADPREIAAAVNALKARNIPRDYVRKRTLERLNVHRSRFLGLINDILTECNAQTRISENWPFTHTPTSNWMSSKQARRKALSGELDDFGQLAAFEAEFE